jgi:hypothetical protein
MSRRRKKRRRGRTTSSMQDVSSGVVGLRLPLLPSTPLPSPSLVLGIKPCRDAMNMVRHTKSWRDMRPYQQPEMQTCPHSSSQGN